MLKRPCSLGCGHQRSVLARDDRDALNARDAQNAPDALNAPDAQNATSLAAVFQTALNR
ncbi:hypothetical protein Pla22_28290 [Rubripirellula amarantea]|uniref:Uncharacterized protein n=1 Tax=Rubripirellula amarantea TaxID=2527999 RepID=A0A5C5WW41_9BACT|nr:hypothetical protein Pla22_28290 [Rubripirellula amarantea]